MNIGISISKSDIKTRKCGNNYELVLGSEELLGSNISLYFSPEAIEEFINDINTLKIENKD